MADPTDKTVSRVALCSAIFAGFAYVGYSVVRNAICRKGSSRSGRRRIDDDGTGLHLLITENLAAENLFRRDFEETLTRRDFEMSLTMFKCSQNPLAKMAAGLASLCQQLRNLVNNMLELVYSVGHIAARYLRDDRPCTFHTIRRLSVASQTDFLLGTLDISNGGAGCGGIVRPLSVQERIRELNLQARQFGGEQGIIMRFSPFYKPRSYSAQCSPWSSPRILSPVDVNQFMSRSAENLTLLSPPSSPILRRKSTSRRRSPSGRPQSGGAAANEPQTIHQVTEVHILLKDSEETLRRRLDGLYNKGRVITPYEAQSLVALLYTRDEGLLLRTLTTITNCAAFSVNQNYLREAGCLSMLINLLSNPGCSQQGRTSAIQAIGNLSLNQENLRELRRCLVPLMANLDKDAPGGEEVILPTLITLTNLAVLPDWHAKYVRILQTLSNFLNRGSEAIQLQVCKLLVNLSCNPDMVPHLLASQAPENLLEMLAPTRDEEFLLRLTTVLDNVTGTVQQHSLAASDLPAEEKAPSPETLYAAIYGLNVTDKLRNRVFVLTKHANEEIRMHAKRIYECLKG